MEQLLKGKVAFVTGAASGIGRASARSLAAVGATVALTDIRTDQLELLGEELASEGARVLVSTLDVTDEAAARRVVNSTAEKLGRIDIVLNCAGKMLLSPIDEADTTEWAEMLNVNALGLMYVTHAALPHLLRSGGTIVQMSSMAGRYVGRGAAGYYASKFAVNGFSEALRLEVTEKGVRVVVVEPGTTETGLREHITHQASKEAIEARVATYRQLQPEDVAAAVMYAVTAPNHVAVNEVLLRPTDQA